jgi:hypothetical protein
MSSPDKPSDGAVALHEAYRQGWLEAADWADRDDLKFDTTSPAYEQARDKRLTCTAEREKEL